MARSTDSNHESRGPWRKLGWGTAVALILLPLFAMQLTDEVAWDAADFVFAGALLAGTGATLELVARNTSILYRAAVGVALAAAFILIWTNAAVGIIGDEGNDANLLYGGVLAVGVIGAVIARLQPEGLACALFATALAQALVGAAAAIAGWGAPQSAAGEILSLTGFFSALWLASAWLFQKSAQEEHPTAQRSAAG